ncbi:MAG TPA: hypothetical protein PL182_09800, partial [Pseudobdellovibrionaceae bacterium]|nr:hypothetical protein [Pseudobdellovibrionaceae bacterium]
MKKVLVTGFLPFAGRSVNPSQVLVERLAELPRFAGKIKTAILPVSYRRAPEVLIDALTAPPSVGAVLMFGLAQKRQKMSLERTAMNWIESGIADEDGEKPAPGPFLPGRQLVYFNSLPLVDWATGMNALGIPSEVSLSAGGYVCNASSYAVADFLSGTDPLSGASLEKPALF